MSTFRHVSPFDQVQCTTKCTRPKPNPVSTRQSVIQSTNMTYMRIANIVIRMDKIVNSM